MMNLNTKEFREMLGESLRNTRNDAKEHLCRLLGIREDEADNLSEKQILERSVGIGIRENWTPENFMFELGYNPDKKIKEDYDGSS